MESYFLLLFYYPSKNFPWGIILNSIPNISIFIHISYHDREKTIRKTFKRELKNKQKIIIFIKLCRFLVSFPIPNRICTISILWIYCKLWIYCTLIACWCGKLCITFICVDAICIHTHSIWEMVYTLAKCSIKGKLQIFLFAIYTYVWVYKTYIYQSGCLRIRLNLRKKDVLCIEKQLAPNLSSLTGKMEK